MAYEFIDFGPWMAIVPMNSQGLELWIAIVPMNSKGLGSWMTFCPSELIGVGATDVNFVYEFIDFGPWMGIVPMNS